MSLNILYNNVARVNHSILLKYLYTYLQYSTYSLEFVNFLKVNGIIMNFICKKDKIIIFFKYSKEGSLLSKIILPKKITLWRWFRFRKIISMNSLFSKQYKKSAILSFIFYTSKGFLFFETAYSLGIGGRYVGQLKLKF